MKTLLDKKKLDTKIGTYCTGTTDSLKDLTILRTVRMRRRQLGQMMRAFDADTAKRRLPAADYFISRKIDGEFTCLIYRGGKAITLNPGGTVRAGAPFHDEAASLLKAAGVKSALIGGELYVRRQDDQRPRVHDVTRVARAPVDQNDVDSLCFGVFNIYDLDGVDLSMRYGEAVTHVQAIFGDGDRVHSVETVTGDQKAVMKQFRKWVIKQGAEGVVVRSDSAGIFKIKQRHTLDLAVLGYSVGTDDRADLLHSLLMAVVREDGSFQIVARVGGGFSDAQRAKLIKGLEKRIVDSDYAEVNSDRIAYHMLKPGPVAEISCLDIISRTSHGHTIDRMVLAWDEKKQCWEGLRRLPLCSIISPQFLRMRDDKQATADDVCMAQLSDIAEIPELVRSADDLKLPSSKLMKRTVGTKVLKDATMVRKLLLWKTNKDDVSRDHPAYVLHLTDYSPNRKAPLQHEIRVSNSRKQIEQLWDKWRKKYYVRGWTEL